MIVGIVGTRRPNWTSVEFFDWIDGFFMNDDIKIDEIVSGGAMGIDKLAERWARARGHKLRIHYPFHSLDSPEKYFRRNHLIAASCDILLCFFNESVSGGTLNTMNKANMLGVRVLKYRMKRGGVIYNETII